MPYRVVFCGTPEFALPSLEALHNHDDFEVMTVLSQPDRPAGRGKKLQPSPVKARALQLGLSVETPAKASSPEVINHLKSLKPDVGVVVAYGQILSLKFLNSFGFGCVNLHSSLLPRWRGAAPMERAILAGDTVTGVSLQKVVKKLDAGDIIAEKQIALAETMGATELYQTLSQMGAALLVENLKAFIEGKMQLKPQDESQVTYAHKIEKSEALIDWDRGASQIHNQVRAFDQGGPFAFTLFKGKNLKIHKSRVVGMITQASPGEIVDVNKESFIVACGNGLLEILIVQPESKPKMSAADFVRGYSVAKGVKLG